MISIRLTSVMIDDQAMALDFYTNVLGFAVRRDIPMGAARWLTVVAPDEPDGTGLLLEPMSGLAEAPGFQKALGVEFRGEPSKPESGPATVVLNDACGNLIQLFQL